MSNNHQSSEPLLPNIKELTRNQLADLMADMGEPRFRAAQLHRWLYGMQARDFETMSSISMALRTRLAVDWAIRSASVVRSESEDGGTVACNQSPTSKYLISLPDGEFVESVLIPSEERMTACISAQVGCPLGCTFCATGQMGFRRNLFAFEMTDQVYAMHEDALKRYGRGLTNIVFMGMGEPLLNLDNVFEAIGTMTEKNYGFSISEKRISISTVGLVPGIQRLTDSGLRIKLALSLHSADQQKRELLMPVAKNYSLDELSSAISAYNRKTGQPVTLVYMMLKGINDSVEDGRKLARFAKRLSCKINLIDYNPIVNFKFKPAYSDSKNAFVRQLLDAGLHVTVRKSQGAAINAACGQLATLSGNDGSKPQ
ncbi:MAG: 23S rRNA (adenine(2503)-C(2))-methyltransferase RlmN [Chlorobiaceae bacterium]|nr:23S rRNA (adenine(2503)-C(2))-methyltransferase RlmN [Chlorobiaceae bacterium]